MSVSNASLDDFVAGFSPLGLPVRGTIVRMGPGTLAPILKRHAYPAHLAQIMGEALLLAVLVGAGLKFDGKVLAQAEGDGPVSMMVGEYRTDGGVRAYTRHEPERWAWLEKVNKGEQPHMPQLFGPQGRLGLIILQDDPDYQPYQGIVPMVKGSLADCARDYFEQSEQVATLLKLAVSRDAHGRWVGAGMLVQKISGDEARGDTSDGWREAQALFSTLSDAELLDPALPPEHLLYRLFHEGGVTIETAQILADACTCSEERLIGTLSAMGDESLRDMVEPDGTLVIQCQFCSREYIIPIDRVTGAVS